MNAADIFVFAFAAVLLVLVAGIVATAIAEVVHKRRRGRP
jgi:hypothetical protein